MHNVTLPKELCSQKEESVNIFIFVLIVLTVLIIYGFVIQISIHMCRVRADEERQDRMDQTLGETRIIAHFPSTP